MLDKAKKSTLDVSGLRTRYDNFIGGAWKAPAKGRYFTNKSPIDGSTLCEVARSDAADVESALDAAHAAKEKWARTSPTERAKMLSGHARRHVGKSRRAGQCIADGAGGSIEQVEFAAAENLGMAR